MARKRNNKKSLVKKIIIVILLIILSSFLAIYLFLYSPTDNKEPKKINISGTSAEVIKELYNKDLIKNEEFAYLFYRVFKSDKTFYEGTYFISPGMNLGNTIDYLTNIDNKASHETVNLTFIPGDWCKHIARKIADNTNIDYDELIAYWNDKKVYKNLCEEYEFLKKEPNDDVKILLEGYLAPDTYNFYATTTKEDVTRTILNQTQKVYDSFKNDFEKSNMSIDEIYTLASIIQYESGNDDEMKKISGVFVNRLNIDMRLESSSTRCYVLNQDRDDSWINCEVNLDEFDPYDTYQVFGLPPGPILSPGKNAIEAALNPEKHDYLYFVGNLNGNSYFAETYEEHEQNICKYLTGECK